MIRRASLADVAARSKVSVSTASYVLSGKPCAERFSEVTRARVELAARELGYVQNRAARSLRVGRTRTVALFHNAPIDRFVEKFETRAASHLAWHNYQLMSVPVLDDDITGVDTLLRSGACDAAIMATMPIEIHRLVATQPRAVVPTLLLGSTGGGHGFDHVMIDEALGIEQALTDLANNGRKRIAFAGQHTNLTECQSDARWRIYSQFQRAHRAEPILLFTASTFVGDIFTAACRALTHVEELPDAVYCSSDRTAIGLVLAAHALGITIPDDLAVIGTGNSAESLQLDPPLSSVGLAPESVNRILEHFWTRLTGHSSPATLSLQWEHFPRATTP